MANPAMIGMRLKGRNLAHQCTKARALRPNYCDYNDGEDDKPRENNRGRDAFYRDPERLARIEALVNHYAPFVEQSRVKWNRG